jgi:lipopolysaccharide export system permease protein
MPVFDRYIVNQIFPPLGFTLLVALLILLVERSLRVLDMVLGNSGPLHYVARMLAYLAPHYIGMALPLAFFLAVVLTFNRLSRESEFDAFLAAGIGLHQLIRPLLVVTAVVFLTAIFVFNYLQPHARYAYRALVSTVQNPVLYAMAKEGVFINEGEVTFLVEDISSDRERYGRIFIYQEDEEGRSAVTTAKTGMLEKEGPGQASAAHLRDGIRLSVTSPEATENSTVTQFDEFRLSLAGDDYGPFRARGRDEREFTLAELWKFRHAPPNKIMASNLVSEFHGRLVRLLSILVLPFLAVSLALGRQRSDRYYGMAAGGIFLFIYHELLQFGERNVQREIAEPWLGLWTPFLVFAAVTALLFYRSAFLVGQPVTIRTLGGLATRIGALRLRQTSPPE